ncbi:2-keto-4-pentenoate hydratase [Sabulicella glaciei]|uniref:Fumarylacetoacetate hydrolase family protein n=1 Tax=Sabulicella glaciei TaxID=2984948 RepID=A0ABT3NVY1_9PROT|nr:fumarylacetoacetate hydrolase family protein [Roseococcus sp. MDT2-1-1]MCW8086321.1 fumarylacetoacetate hydrolase family protein [Roseococcus sp. MDT2-1-1]
MADSRLATLLLDAWKGGAPVPASTAPPADAAAAYAVQSAMLDGIGLRGGWKVGAASPSATPLSAPLPAGCLLPSGTVFPGAMRGVELELALRLSRDVPAGEALRRSDFDAMLPAIEVVETRLAGWERAPALLKLADLQTHGALVLGEPIPMRDLDFSALEAELRLDGEVVAATRGANTAGSLEWLLHGLSRRLAARGEALRQGEILTTGSLTGMLFAAPGARALGRLAGIGEVALRFEG